MDYKDYYSILGVPKTATQKEIQSAYRRLARKYHPDVNRGDNAAEAKFKEINEAHQVLGDPEQRKKYDTLGANWRQYEQWQPAAGTNGQQFDWSQFGFGSPGQGGRRAYSTYDQVDVEDLLGGNNRFSDFFNTFFSGSRERASGRGRTAGRRSQDVEQPVEVTLEEAFAGGTRTLQLAEATGRTRRLEVKIPAGVREGSRIRVAGQGTPSPLAGAAGDIYLVVHILPHPTFERRGDDLSERVPVPLATAVLGGEVEVPTLRGKVALKIPAETQNGRVFRLRGLGMPRLEDPHTRGDLLAEVRVLLPEHLSPRERELFEELARLRSGTHAGSH